MKSICALSLLCLGLVQARKDAKNRRWDPDHPIWTFAPDCTANPSVVSVVSQLQTPPTSFDYNPFCSGLLQPWALTFVSITSTGPVTGTTTVVSTIKMTTPATTTVTSAATVTDLCPIPSASMGCGIAALAWSDYTLKNIVVDTTPEDCHQICLGNSSCLAFQTIDARDPNDPTNRYCRLYKQPIRSDNAGYNDPWPNDIFYDRDCPDHLPSGCTAAAAITQAPAAHLEAREIDKRDYTAPPFLSTVYAGLWDAGCSCLITSASPLLINTVGIPVDNVDRTTTSYTQTHTTVFTARPNFSTVYKTVA